jgi:dihydropyrimidinase
VKAIDRVVTLAEIAVAPVDSVHVSSEGALREVYEAHIWRPRLRQTCHSNLLLSIEGLESPDFEGAKYVLTPPQGP